MSRPKVAPEARQNIGEIFQYIERDNRSAALRVAGRLEETFELLAAQPMMGEQHNEFGENVRLFSVDKYVVFFRPLEDTVEILAVIHGARDLNAVFQKSKD